MEKTDIKTHKIAKSEHINRFKTQPKRPYKPQFKPTFNKYQKPGNSRYSTRGRDNKPALSAKVQEKIKQKRAVKTQQAAAKAAEEAEERKQFIDAKNERIQQYKKKRLERTKAISKKTSRGQPLMKDRMELLLKQIQEMKRS